jgi:hypothetical protein
LGSAFEGIGRTLTLHDPCEYVSATGKWCRPASATVPMATQKDAEEQDVEKRFIDSGALPFGSTVGMGAPLGVQDSCAALAGAAGSAVVNRAVVKIAHIAGAK